MTGRPQKKFEKCKVFLGKPEEDALDWLTWYCDIAQYNRWRKADLRANFHMYLNGAARQWFLCLPNKPTEWNDVAADVGPLAIVVIDGLRTRVFNLKINQRFKRLAWERAYKKLTKDSRHIFTTFSICVEWSTQPRRNPWKWIIYFGVWNLRIWRNSTREG